MPNASKMMRARCVKVEFSCLFTVGNIVSRHVSLRASMEARFAQSFLRLTIGGITVPPISCPARCQTVVTWS